MALFGKTALLIFTAILAVLILIASVVNVIISGIHTPQLSKYATDNGGWDKLSDAEKAKIPQPKNFSWLGLALNIGAIVLALGVFGFALFGMWKNKAEVKADVGAGVDKVLNSVFSKKPQGIKTSA